MSTLTRVSPRAVVMFWSGTRWGSFAGGRLREPLPAEARYDAGVRTTMGTPGNATAISARDLRRAAVP